MESEPKRVHAAGRPVFNVCENSTIDNIKRCFQSFWEDDPIYNTQSLTNGITVANMVWRSLPLEDLYNMIFKNLYHCATRKLLEPGAKASQYYSLLSCTASADFFKFDMRRLSNDTMYEILNCIVLLGGSPHLYTNPGQQFRGIAGVYKYLHSILYPVYLSSDWKEYAHPSYRVKPYKWFNSLDYAVCAYPWDVWPVIFYLRDKFYQAMTPDEVARTYPKFPQFEYAD